MCIEPDNTGLSVVEARYYARAGIASSGEHQGQPPSLDSLLDGRCKPLAHDQGSIPAIAKRLATFNPLHSHGDTLGSDQLLRSGLNEAQWPVPLTLVPHYVGNLDDRYVHSLSLPVSDRKSTRLNSSHVEISYAVFCLKKKKKK